MSRRHPVLRAASPLLVALAFPVAACGGDDDPPSGDDAPSGTTPPNPGVLPPALLDCFADAGFTIESPDDLHAAPPEVVEECFTTFHDGGT